MKSEVRVSTPKIRIYVTIGVTMFLIAVVAMLLYPDAVRSILYATAAVILLSGGGRVAFVAAHGWQGLRRVRLENDSLAIANNERRLKSKIMVVPRTDGYIRLDTNEYYGPVMANSGPVVDSTARQLPDGADRRRNLFGLIQMARHIAFLGETGSGKSHQMAHAIEEQRRQHPGAMLIIMDSHIKKNTWPTADESLWRYEDMAARINWLFGELDKRTDPHNDDDWQTIIVAVDELPAVMDECREIDKNTKRYFTRLLREAWKFDIFFIVGTQSQLADDIDMNSATRKNFWWIGLEPEMTRRNVGVLLSNHFKPVEEIELAGPYHPQSGGRFFSRAQQQALRLPPPPEPEPNEAKLCALPDCDNPVSDRAKYCSDACRQKAYRGRN